MAPKKEVVEDIDTEKETKEFAVGLVDTFRQNVVKAFTPPPKAAAGRRKSLSNLKIDKTAKVAEIVALREKKKCAQEVVLSKVFEMNLIDEIYDIKEGELTEIECKIEKTVEAEALKQEAIKQEAIKQEAIKQAIEAKEKEDKSSKPPTKQ